MYHLCKLYTAVQTDQELEHFTSRDIHHQSYACPTPLKLLILLIPLTREGEQRHVYALKSVSPLNFSASLKHHGKPNFKQRKLPHFPKTQIKK